MHSNSSAMVPDDPCADVTRISNIHLINEDYDKYSMKIESRSICLIRRETAVC